MTRHNDFYNDGDGDSGRIVDVDDRHRVADELKVFANEQYAKRQPIPFDGTAESGVNEEVAERLGKKYRFVQDTIKEQRPPRPMRTCARCECDVFASFIYCTKCAKILGIYEVPRKEWPEVLKEQSRAHRKEIETDSKYENETDRLTDIPSWVTSAKYEKSGATLLKQHQIDSAQNLDSLLVRHGVDPDKFDVFNDNLGQQQVLNKYGVTDEEHRILTSENLRILAEELETTHVAIRKRKERISKRLRNQVRGW